MAEKKASHSKTSTGKYGHAASDSVEDAMHRRKEVTLRSGKDGKGGKVKSRKQAIAIGLSEAKKKLPKCLKRRASGHYAYSLIVAGNHP